MEFSDTSIVGAIYLLYSAALLGLAGLFILLLWRLKRGLPVGATGSYFMVPALLAMAARLLSLSVDFQRSDTAWIILWLTSVVIWQLSARVDQLQSLEGT